MLYLTYLFKRSTACKHNSIDSKCKLRAVTSLSCNERGLYSSDDHSEDAGLIILICITVEMLKALCLACSAVSPSNSSSTVWENS